MMKRYGYNVKEGDVLRHHSGNGWVRMVSCNGDTFLVTDVDFDPDTDEEIPGITHILTERELLACVKAETGMVYDYIVFT